MITTSPDGYDFADGNKKHWEHEMSLNAQYLKHSLRESGENSRGHHPRTQPKVGCDIMELLKINRSLWNCYIALMEMRSNVGGDDPNMDRVKSECLKFVTGMTKVSSFVIVRKNYIP